jgi:tRNA(Ile)-lysidine synthase
MLIRQVKKTIDRHHLLDRDDRMVVAVSGGVDSMVMLHLLNALRKDLGLCLIVAHVNHGLRPDESKKEAELVEQESTRLGLPFECGQFDAREFSRAAGLSLQDGARRIRLHFFRTLLLKYEARKLALGHNADDQVETILLRLFRGSGLKGLKGMLPIRERRVIRPLLETWRKEIESFAREKKIPYLTDSSNLKRDYLRNRIRLDLIPLIEREYQSNFKELVLRTSAILREEDDCLDREAEKAFQAMVHEEPEEFSFRSSHFNSLNSSIQWRVLLNLLDRAYHEERCEEAWSSIDPLYEKLRHSRPSFLLELPHGIQVEKRYDKVRLKKGKINLVPPFEVEVSAAGRTLIEELGKEVWVEEFNGELREGDLTQSPEVVFLDYQKLQFPLTIRNFRPGDRFKPLGVKGEQKLKEFFIDHKIPRFERPGICLLISGERIVWVVGYRISEEVKITEQTKRVLRMKFCDMKS